MRTAKRLEVQSQIPNRSLEKWAKEARDYLGVALEGLEHVGVYKLEGVLDDAAVQKAGAEVFADPVLQKLYLKDHVYDFKGRKPAFVVEVAYRAGVTDNPARSAQEALALTGVKADVASGAVYFLFGNLSRAGAERVARELLANDLIQKTDIYTADEFYAGRRFEKAALPHVHLQHNDNKLFESISLERDDAELEKLSKDRLLALTLSEMKHIRDYFRREDVRKRRAQRQLPQDPTDVELEILAQSWSEHCKHKIFGASVAYTEGDVPDGFKKLGSQKINSLYKTFVKRATHEIQQERKLQWLISVFSDNAGIVRFDDKLDVCIKVETHNSPSALDPYGGALTGILGVNRDILGCGLGAKPIANTDVFCFAPPTMPEAGEEMFMPEGVKSPRRILEGVHKGVEDGGNKSGIPTVNGAFFFDRDYAGKPLVFVGTVGVLPPVLPDGRNSAEKKLSVGDRVVIIGGAIGADGIHGATFSSLEMDENAPATAVQIGDPLTQKRVLDFLMEARDLGLYSAITDNGAGGLSSSVGEMAQMSGGASMDLALCPVKYPGLKPWELMVSESQERMSLAVPEKHIPAFMELAARRGVSACNIGAFNDSGTLSVSYNGALVAELVLSFVHDSLPPMQLTATWSGGQERGAWSATTELSVDARRVAPHTLGAALLELLASPNITSKEKWVRAYDHEVQASTHGKPFTGKQADGAGDAGVVWLHPHGGNKESAVVISCGMAPRLSQVDPYLMAQFAVDEAVRNAVVSGGDPDKLCLLDNFCWPDPVAAAKNPHGEYRMGQLVRTCCGLYDICKAYGAPLVSGKDSMKNDFKGKDKRGEAIAFGVLPTLMVTAMAKAEMGTTPPSGFVAAGDDIYVLGGLEGLSFAASECASVFAVQSPDVPAIELEKNITCYRALHGALKAGLIQSAHDLSEGGLLVALAESMIGGRLGATLSRPLDALTAFGEGAGRILVSVSPQQKPAFEKAFWGVSYVEIGKVTNDSGLVLANGETIALDALVTAWKKGF